MMLLIAKGLDLDRKYIFEQKGWVLHRDLSERKGTQEKRLRPERERSKTAETVPKTKESTEKRKDFLKRL